MIPQTGSGMTNRECEHKLLKSATTAAVLAISAFFGCAPTPSHAVDTAGERFRKVIADIDAWCRAEKMGPYLDPSDPDYRYKRRGTDCEILNLEPRDWRTEKMVKAEGQHFPIPERWLATPEGRFAHSLKLPSPHDKVRSVYRDGMGRKEYFEALCREEAGEIVLSIREGVKVVFEARPRFAAQSAAFSHLYSLEDPYGYVNGETSQRIGAVWTAGKAYRAIERATSDGGFVHLFRQSVGDRNQQRVLVKARVAKYGFVWRGIVRPHDRENGIAGGELVAFDVATSEVLGFRRGFAVTEIGPRGTSWEFAPVCPNSGLRGGAQQRLRLRSLVLESSTASTSLS